MLFLAWILIIGLGALSVAAFVRRYAQFGVFFGGSGIMAAVAIMAHLGGLAVLVLCALWTIALVLTVVLKPNKDFWSVLGVLVIGAVLLLATPLGNTTNTTSASPTATQNVGGQQAQAQASPGTGTVPKTCDTKFVQQWQDNPDYRVIDGGLYEDVAHKKITPKQADAKQRTIIGHDVRALAGYAHQEGLRDNAEYTDLLTPKKDCLSTQGIALYEKLTKKWDSGKVSIAQAPADATNTGMEDGVLVANATSGISGDRTALKRTYSNGTSSYTLARCGNPALPGKSKLPSGHTDQQPPKTQPSTPVPTPSTTTPAPPTTAPPTTAPPTTAPPTTTPPTTTPPTTTPPTTTPPEQCKPNQVWDTGSGQCLDTKDPSSNVPEPSGKPTAPAPSGPAESTAPVETHPADPTTQPGDEATGVPAPGASQQPTDQPTQPPATGAPTGDDKGTGIGDPDQASASASASPAAGMAFFPLGGGLLAWGLRRRRDKKVAARR